MKRLSTVTLVSAFAILVLLSSLAFAAGVTNLTSTDAKSLLARNPKIYVLDVRTPEEYRQAYLKGSHLIPLGELERRVAEVPRQKPVLVYCSVGQRSLVAAQYLASHGYKEIYQISDGLIGWYRKGYPIERGR
ncbi:rhodanese-like domain-containing protein [Geomonas sp. Red32]|uniref:rhodanese-like domain-containing protein n=1 Tax=Geomonas sp. Red32 TaxID=2912856 RepID=UPI00202CAD5A|nr:rhodanese-like domain-containing protein [Geomonas sp. Red32]MCM0081047.1 rhodanese-like domain-containing protein [Geomonas sp. Red32]